MNPRLVLGLTMGDPAGVGPELCLRALQEATVLEQCVPVLFGDMGILERVAATVGTRFPGNCRALSLAEWERLEPGSEPWIVDCRVIAPASVVPGIIAAACGKAAFAYLERAVRAASERRIHGVVTAPIHKEAFRLAGVPHPGQTEVFTELTGARRSCMMLHSEALTVSMVTTHVGYAEVPEKLSIRRVLDVIELTAQAMARMRGRAPRLGICGLNPHAGEHGLFGQQEEERIIQPAIAQSRQQGIAIEGPLPPDAAFTTVSRARLDAIITLYHDQGHIPFKMVAFDTGVNITLGLPIIRTSVDHGTAFDIAWRGTASPQSLYAAIRAAVELARGKWPEVGVP